MQAATLLTFGNMINELSKRRSNVEVVADILRLGEAGKTEVLYGANLSHRQLEKYLSFLLNEGFLEKVAALTPGMKYRTTSRGTQLLENIDAVIDSLGGY